MENLELGLLLLLVGMTTVFAILILIIYLGKFLIAVVNKYVPEEVLVKAPDRSAAIPMNVVAAITAAVNVVTHSKGKIINIEKK